MGVQRKAAMIALAAAVAAGGTTAAQAAGKGGGGTKPAPAPSSITLDQSAARLADGSQLQIGSAVTFTSVVGDLAGGEWPMVYVACYSLADGSLVYGQLDHPETVFVLGGGSSPWLSVGGDTNCVGQLRAYGGKSKGVDTIRLLAETAPFYAAG